MDRPVNILGFAGSLRRGSYNRALLRQAANLLPEGASLEIFEIDGIPLFNQDIELAPPESVRQFKSRIRAAAAILIVTPEYNYGVPGVLKNAIDWASRPHADNAFEGKPVALMSASTGRLGGARAQYQLRQTFVTLNMFPVNRPEVFVTLAREKFDDKGALLDEKTRDLVSELLDRLVTWTRRLQSA